MTGPAGPQPRPADRRVATAVVVVLIMVGAFAALLARSGGRPIDLEVYRTAGAVWRAGLPLYRDGYPHGLGVYLPFTYPPFAALLLGLSSWLPSPVALAALGASSLLALAASTLLAVGAVRPAPSAGAAGPGAPPGPSAVWSRLTQRPVRRALLVTGAVGLVATTLEPVRATLYFGQVNLLLMALVAADVLLPRTRWPRGVLLGLAAAVKLTPLAFLLVLVCRRRWRAAATAGLTFLVAHGLGALLLPDDSRDYWLGGVLTDPTRVGAGDTSTNQSLRGVLARLWPTAPTAVWLALAAAVGLLTAAGTLRRARCGDDLGALLTTAAGGLLVSPVSWTHHWVWLGPALVWLVARTRAARGLRRQVSWWGTGAVAVAALVGPDRVLRAGAGPPPHWTWWEQAVGDTYAWLAVAALLLATLSRSPGARPRHRASDTPTTSSEASTQAVVGRAGTRTPR